MDSFEFNKIAGAVLGTALFVLLVSFVSGTIFASHAPETPVYLAELASAENTDGGTPAPVEAEEPIGMMMASADAGSGENVFKKCKACHTPDEGGKNGIGPNLWNVVGRQMASVDGYDYSAAMVGFADGGKVWDYETLNAFLVKPKSYIDGTKMSFGGLSKGKDRADLILYLRSLSNAPAAMPAAGDSAAMTEEKPEAAAETETAAAENSTETAATESPASASSTMTAADAEKPGDAAAAETTGTQTTTAETTMAAKPAAGEADGVLAMIAGQDPADGEKVFKKCKACHTSEESGKNKIGPALWNVVNRPVASVESFASKYSDAMKAHGEGGTVWNYAELDAYLASPKSYIPGNKMSFAGLRKEKDRAAILAYMRTLALDPAPLP